MPRRLDDDPTIAARIAVRTRDVAPMSVLLLGASADDISTYQRRLPLGAGAIAVTSPELAVVLAPLAECIVIVDGTPDERALESDAEQLLGANPGLAIVCATRDPERIAPLQDAGLVDVVLEYDAPMLALRIALEGARTSALLRKTAHAMIHAGHLPTALRDILIHLLVRTPPLHSVREACTDEDVNRRTLWYQWEATVGEELPVGLRGIVTWILVLRASVLRARGHTWHDAAARIGVHRHTLARAVRERGFAMNPDPWVDLASGVHSALRQEFRDNVVRHLIGR